MDQKDEPARDAATFRASGIATWLLGGIGALCVFAMMFTSVADALLRTFADAPIIGAHDVMQVLQVVAVACAIPLCVLSGRDITIDTLADRLPHPVRRIVDIVVPVLGAAILAIVAYRCYVNGTQAADFGETTLLVNIPFGPFYHALAAGLALSAIVLLTRVRLRP